MQSRVLSLQIGCENCIQVLKSRNVHTHAPFVFPRIEGAQKVLVEESWFVQPSIMSPQTSLLSPTPQPQTMHRKCQTYLLRVPQ